jgi:glycosyltransferase involved in cell wall biosynthesis
MGMPTFQLILMPRTNRYIEKAAGSAELQDQHLLERTRVAMIIRQFYPHLTGVVTQYRQLGSELKARGVDLTVYTASTEIAIEPEVTIDEILVKRFNIYKAEDGISGPEADFRLLDRAMASWAESGAYPDAVVLLGVTRKMIRHLLALRFRGVRLVLAVTIYPEFEEESNWSSMLKWRINSFLQFNLCDVISVYSSTFVSLYSRCGVAKKKFAVVPFPVDCHKFHPCSDKIARANLRGRLNLKPEGEVVVFVGSVIERKGASLLLEAWLSLETRFPEAVLVFVGPYGDRETLLLEKLRSEHENFLKRFRALLKRLNRPDSVVMTGSVENPQDYFRSADVFAFPTHLEGMGGVIPEAMACGLPCVLTRFKGFPEVEFGVAGREYLETEYLRRLLLISESYLLHQRNENESERMLGSMRFKFSISLLLQTNLPKLAVQLLRIRKWLPHSLEVFLLA